MVSLHAGARPPLRFDELDDSDTYYLQFHLNRTFGATVDTLSVPLCVAQVRRIR